MLFPEGFDTEDVRRAPRESRPRFKPRASAPPACSCAAEKTGASAAFSISLLRCPEVCPGTQYELIRRDEAGAVVLRYAGVLTSPHPSLNLAKLRHRGARLGASEVALQPPAHCRAQPVQIP